MMGFMVKPIKTSIVCCYTKQLSDRYSQLFKCWTLLILHPMKNRKTYTISDRIVWHPLFGVEPTPAGLEPAVLTVILRGMAPSLRADRRPPGSEPDVQTATPRGFKYISIHSHRQFFFFHYILEQYEI